jgi:hypothetical protein
LMEHPETKAIAELRPLFVEMVSDDFADCSICTGSPRILAAQGSRQELLQVQGQGRLVASVKRHTWLTQGQIRPLLTIKPIPK